MMVILRKKLRIMLMGKPTKKIKRAFAPYTKYKKTPHKYSPAYYKWRADRLAGRVQNIHETGHMPLERKIYKEAAE